MNLNMQTVRSYLGQAAQTAKELSSQAAVAAKDLSSQVIGAKCLRDYNMQTLTGSAGPGCMWKIFAARSKKEGISNPLASVWILDKRAVTEASRGNARLAETFLQLCRKDAANLAKLKHPDVVRLLEPFEETRSQLVMVTEAVTASLADVIKLRKASAVDGGGAGSLHLSELEIKHGFLQVAEGLHFLHSQANQIHRGISPEGICVTAGGAWKLAGFGFAVLADFGSNSPAEISFDYSDSSSSLTAQALKKFLWFLQPSLSYTAPELVNSAAGNIFSAADVFSLGVVMYDVIGDRQLLDVGQSVYEYRSKIASFMQLDLSAVPYELQTLLGQMLSTAPAARPSAISMTGSQYFQGDQMLRALRFMDSMIQRDSVQKVAFLNDLTTFWDKFDDRILRLKVLPHLLEEVRSEQLQQIALPLVIHILGKQNTQDFADTTAPALAPIFQSAKGDTLLLLIRNTPTMLMCMPRNYVTSMLVPLFAKAADQGEIRCQEEMLKQLPAVAHQTDYSTLKAELLPRMHSLCLKTTSASVRVNSLNCMARLAARLDEDEAAKMLLTAGKVSAVDHTASTVMCVLGLGDCISKQYGLGMAAKEVLPMLTPLLVLPSLSGQQFTSAMSIVRGILSQIEKKRARELDVPDHQALAAGSTAQASSNPGTPNTSTPSWDTGPAFQQSQPAQRQSSAQPSLDFPGSQLQPQSSSSRPASQSSRYAASNGHSAAHPSWQGSPRGAGAELRGTEGSASDPFANMPAPIAQTSSASTGYQGNGNDMVSDSLFSGLTTGRNSSRPATQSQRYPSTPGDQLANVIGGDDSSSLFVDPSWRDPCLGSAAQQPAPSSHSMQTSSMGMTNPTMLHQTSPQGMPNAMSATDAFSQLSLSRGPSGNAHHQQCGAAVQSRFSGAKLPQLGSSGSGTGGGRQNNAASKGLVSLAPGKQSSLGAQSIVNGVAPVDGSTSNQSHANQSYNFSLI